MTLFVAHNRAHIGPTFHSNVRVVGEIICAFLVSEIWPIEPEGRASDMEMSESDAMHRAAEEIRG